MKNIMKLAISFLIAATSSIAIAGGNTLPVHPDITDTQLVPATKNQIAQAASTTSSNGVVTPNSAASGIVLYRVIDVASADYPVWEPIAAGQTSTTPQGGAWIYVMVEQLGYGNPNNSYLGGYVGTNVSTAPLCGTLSAPTYSCPAGSTIIGWVYIYGFAGPQSGQFTSSAYSTASPFGTKSTSLYIQ
jgi:ABC-type molybdate transport system substrate-binding protein